MGDSPMVKSARREPLLRPVGKKTRASLEERFKKNVIVVRQPYTRGWTDEKTGRYYSAFGFMAHCGTQVLFYRPSRFCYRGKLLGALAEHVSTRYIEGDSSTRGDVVVEPSDKVLSSTPIFVPLDSPNATPWDGEPVEVAQ